MKNLGNWWNKLELTGNEWDSDAHFFDKHDPDYIHLCIQCSYDKLKCSLLVGWKINRILNIGLEAKNLQKIILRWNYLYWWGTHKSDWIYFRMSHYIIGFDRKHLLKIHFKMSNCILR